MTERTTENWLTEPRHDEKAAYEKKKREKQSVSNDRSRHDDSKGLKTVRIGAILPIFEDFKVFAILRK